MKAIPTFKLDCASNQFLTMDKNDDKILKAYFAKEILTSLFIFNSFNSLFNNSKYSINYNEC